MKSTPILLLILDGWGVRVSKKDNAILQAKTPMMDSLMKKYSSTLLEASGPAVGLPSGIFGNSEVGHMTIGAGKIVESHQTRINKSLRDRSFFKNKKLLSAIKYAKKNKGRVHLVGLLSDRGVHSHQDHLFACLKLCKIHKVYPIVHMVLDGRDTPPKSAKKYVKRLYKELRKIGTGGIGSVGGRYFYMDRDNNWARTKKAYDVMVGRIADFMCDDSEKSVLSMMDHFYRKKVTDEFIPPFITGRNGIVDQCVKKGDSFVMFNFREDRASQLVHCFVDKRFGYFKRSRVTGVHVCTFTEYDNSLKNDVAFETLIVRDTLGEVYSKKKIRQLRIAETEKYAHVTYFFNALRQRPFPYEKRILIPSSKVSTYDKKPLMKAKEITDIAVKVIKDLKRNKYGLIVVNFANADMVGHTGNFSAAVRAIEFEDKCVGRLVKAMSAMSGVTVITADHGNAETMNELYKSSHSFAKVPFIVCSDDKIRLKAGGLSQVAPSVLKLAGIAQPKKMSAEPLF